MRAIAGWFPQPVRKEVRRSLEQVPEKLGLPSLVEPDLAEHWARVIARSSRMLQALPPITGPRIVLFSTLARGRKWPARLSILAWALRLRGADPIIVACDRWLEACGEGNLTNFTLQEFATNGARRFCDTCFVAGTDAVYGKLRLPYRPLSEFEPPNARARASNLVSPLDYAAILSLRSGGIEIGAIVESSLLFFLLRGSRPPLENPYIQLLARRYAFAAILLADTVDEMLRRVRPDVIVVPINVYTEEVAGLVASARGVRIATVELPVMGGETDRWGVGMGASIHKELAYRSEGPWEAIQMDAGRNARLDRWLSDREAGRTRYTFAKRIDDTVSLARELDFERGKPVMSTFLPVPWETVTYNDETYRRNDAILDAIRVVAARPHLQLVVRLHPREIINETKESFETLIREEFATLPTNIRLVRPESRINSYLLGRMSDVVIVHGSTLGLELACQGKAVICTGAPPYRRKGFTFDAPDRRELERLVDSLDRLQLDLPPRTQAARRFAYYLWFMRELPMPLWHRPGVRQEPGFGPWWATFRTLDDLGPGRHPSLDVICDALMLGREPYLTTG